MLVAQELVLVALFVVRRRPTESSRQPLHWFVAMAARSRASCSGPPRHHPGLAGDVGLLLQVIGACAAVICLTGLGRSFGIVAANRGLKVGGPYRIVRHPIYAAYLIGWAGYLLASPTLRNVVVLGVSILFQLLRIGSEEAPAQPGPGISRLRRPVAVPLDSRDLLVDFSLLEEELLRRDRVNRPKNLVSGRLPRRSYRREQHRLA